MVDFFFSTLIKSLPKYFINGSKYTDLFRPIFITVVKLEFYALLFKKGEIIPRRGYKPQAEVKTKRQLTDGQQTTTPTKLKIDQHVKHNKNRE